MINQHKNQYQSSSDIIKKPYNLDMTYDEITKYANEWKDQSVSRSIQNMLALRPKQEKEKIIEALIPHLKEMNISVFGNFIVQKMIENSEGFQQERIQNVIEKSFEIQSYDTYGCRIIQKYFDAIAMQEERLQKVQEQNIKPNLQKLVTGKFLYLNRYKRPKC